MNKKEIVKNIEEGLINFYLNKDQSLFLEAMTEEGININAEIGEYEDAAKKILFTAKANYNADRIDRLISLLKDVKKQFDPSQFDKSKIVTTFNRYIKEHRLAVNYRNLDEMDEEEIRDILMQMDLTTLMNELDSEFKNE
jgi:hypothetical protein